MKKTFAIAVFLTVFAAGCNTDIVTTSQLKTIKNKCVCITPIDSQDPYVGKVLRDVIEKEFIRKHIQLCNADTANVILTGSTFLTTRAHGEVGAFNNLLGGKSFSAQAIESVTVIAKDKAGNILLTGSYNNVDQFTASKLAQEFGSTLADKLR